MTMSVSKQKHTNCYIGFWLKATVQFLFHFPWTFPPQGPAWPTVPTLTFDAGAFISLPLLLFRPTPCGHRGLIHPVAGKEMFLINLPGKRRFPLGTHS